MKVKWAYLTFHIDFKSEKEAQEYIDKNKQKNKDWYFVPDPQSGDLIKKFSNEPDVNGNMFAVTVYRPWCNYNNGWNK